MIKHFQGSYVAVFSILQQLRVWLLMTHLLDTPAATANSRQWQFRLLALPLLLSWLPVVGDPLCTLAGWWRLPFWPCVLYMAIGKFLRYLSMTSLLLYVPDSVWLRLGGA